MPENHLIFGLLRKVPKIEDLIEDLIEGMIEDSIQGKIEDKVEDPMIDLRFIRNVALWKIALVLNHIVQNTIFKSTMIYSLTRSPHESCSVLFFLVHSPTTMSALVYARRMSWRLFSHVLSLSLSLSLSTPLRLYLFGCTYNTPEHHTTICMRAIRNLFPVHKSSSTYVRNFFLAHKSQSARKVSES